MGFLLSTSTPKQREKMDLADFAGPSRSYPIVDQSDVDAAARLLGKAADPAAVKARVIAIAKRKGLTLPDAWDTDAKQADEPTATTVHVDAPLGAGKPKGRTRAYLERMYQSLKDLVPSDRWTTAMASARGHAGGTAKAERAALQAYEPWDLPVMVPPTSDDDDDDNDSDDTPRLEKADPRVHYRPATQIGQQCSACGFYDADADDPYPQCRIVEGYIAPIAVCDLLNIVGSGPAPAAASDASVDTSAAATEPRAAAEPHAAIEPPAWIPYLPVPGTYQHAVYGDIALTPERIGRFVDQFKAGVYQSRLPLDAEHQTKLSGATGWITDMRRNADGSADAAVAWTDRGAAMLRADRFGYVSPEWFEEWTDPATGTAYHDIAIGGALTTRPFFKDKALRPLAAAEAVGVALDLAPRGAQEDSMPEPTTPAGAGEQQAFAERITALEAERDAARQMAEAASTAAQQATERVTVLETDARRQRFTELVEGRGGASDGQRWYGDIPQHVAFLERLAGAFGEDSEELQQYVAQNRAHAEQLRTSGLFAEVGQTGIGAQADVTTQIAAKVAALRATEPTLTEAGAWDAVLRAEPALYSEYRAQQAPKGR